MTGGDTSCDAGRVDKHSSHAADVPKVGGHGTLSVTSPPKPANHTHALLEAILADV